MRRLGAIIAGGTSSRFGSDKAAFEIAGVALIDHVAAALRPHVEAVVVAGRDWPGLTSVADRPQSLLGPLGGLCGALFYARNNGFDGVISAACDTLPLPVEIIFGDDTPVIVDTQPLIGWWPVGLSEQLELWLAGSQSRSVYRWAETVGAAYVTPLVPVYNLNDDADVAKWIAAGAPGA